MMGPFINIYCPILPVENPLAKFLGVESGTKLAMPEVTKKVYAILDSKGLLYETDKRVFRVDNEISELFSVPMTVNNFTSPHDEQGFNFGTLQKYVACAWKKSDDEIKEKSDYEIKEKSDDEIIEDSIGKITGNFLFQSKL